MFIHRITDNLHLKMFHSDDAEALFQVTDQFRDYLRVWLPWVDDTKTVENSRAFIQASMNQYAENNGFQAGIWAEGQLVGCIGFHHIDWNNKRTSIGYWLAEAFQGRGIMTSAVEAMLAIAFDEYRLTRVEILAATGNHRSQAIPTRLGFTREGCLRQHEWLYDHYVDHVVYSMLCGEWRDRQKTSQ